MIISEGNRKAFNLADLPGVRMKAKTQADRFWLIFLVPGVCQFPSPNHARDNEYLFSQTLKYAPEWGNNPALEITPEDVVKLAEKWAADLHARKKSGLMVNKPLVALQSAWNCPRGSRRAPREYPFNPFSHVERFSIEKPAKLLPTDKQAEAVLKAAEGEGRRGI